MFQYSSKKDGLISDTYCENYCKLGMFLIGIREDKTWTVHSLIVSASLAMSFLCWIYTCFWAEKYDLEVFHHLSLLIMGTGLTGSFLSEHEKIADIAIQAEKYHSYKHVNLKTSYKEMQKIAFSSGVRKMGNFFVVVVIGIWLNIIREDLYQGFFGDSEFQLPIGMVLPFRSPYLIITAHLIQTMYIFSAIVVDSVILQIFITISLQLTVQLKTLAHALDQVATNISELQGKTWEWHRDLLAECIQHHQDILRTFDKLKSFYGLAFHFIYFGMVWAIALSRSIMLEDHIDFVNLSGLLLLEILYLSLFCYSADEIIEASESVNFAIYSSNWTLLPRSIRSDVIMVMVRTSKQPTIRLFLGGSIASRDTITLVVNATLTFLMVSLLLK